MMSSGFNLSRRSTGHGGVALVDEGTGLINHFFHNRGKVNHQHLENWRGKPEQSSKLLDENITTDKKTDSNRGTFSQFPGKPSDNIADLDVESTAKNPPLGISELPGIFYDGMTSRDSNGWMEATNETSKLVLTESHVIFSSSGKSSPQSRRSQINNHRAKQLTDGDYSHWWTIKPIDERLVQGSDGKQYRLQRGPPGMMGPTGEDVSPSFFFSLLSPILILTVPVCY